ncbi:UbiA family prenyltransferase [Streptomyces sp. NPDC050759]|uniref:UbiA family prenyltransferase n=1 Tax=Streptomyces sp. NPDC050759 TaxID=3365635 RepID=UPI0037A73BC6
MVRASRAAAPEGLSKSGGGGAGGTTATPTPPPRTHRSRPDRARARARAWAELLRLPALFTVPGDALAGAAAVSARPSARTLLAIASSVCLYEAGMALNDWADRDVDAVERPHRPLPSGRIRPAAALGAACALTGAGLTLAACAGRPALTVAAPLAATVWAYDLALKNTPAGPFAMATARGLDLLLGAAATAGAGAGGRRSAVDDGVRGGGAGRAGHDFAAYPKGEEDRRVVTGTSARKARVEDAGVFAPRAGVDGAGRKDGACRAWATAVADEPRSASGAATVPGAVHSIRRALPSAALLGAHTLAVTTVSRREAQGGSPLAPFAALAATAALTRTVIRQRSLPTDRIDGSRRGTGSRSLMGRGPLADLAAAAVSRLPRPLRQTSGHLLQTGSGSEPLDTHAALRLALAAAYAATTARPYLHATLNPSPPLTQRAVTAGIRATIPLQASLTARSGAKGATATALLITALGPLAGRFARKVSVT